jgi:peroxiredoxin
MLAAGTKAPEFALDDMAGGKRGLSEILAKGPALVVLYKISCPTCQMAMPYIERISKGSLKVVGISQDDSRGTARFQENLGLTMPTLLDRESEGFPASNGFGITHVPSLFLVEPDGTISSSSTGFSKHEFEALGKRAGVETFRPEDHVPEWKAG